MTESSSSAETAGSKTQQDALRLGQQLVAELQLEPSVDTLGRWMAHHIADLMTQAEQADDATTRAAAQQNAADAILRLWDHRASYKQISPLADLEPSLRVLRLLAEEPQWWRDTANTKYGEAARHAYTLLRSITICLTLMESGDAEAAEQAVAGAEQTRDWQSEEEREVVQHLRTWLELGREEEVYGAVLEHEAGSDTGSATMAGPAETGLQIVDQIEATLSALRASLQGEGEAPPDLGANHMPQ